MEAEILSIITVITTFVLGLVAKKVKWINNNLIPIQNLIIGLVFATIEWVITKDFKTAIALSGLLTGGAYDLGHNLKKLLIKEK